MAADDNTLLRLLCHLAWLRDLATDASKRQTLDWARRVYNSATHLQFRFVYPCRPHERVNASHQQSLAKALEELVSTASKAVAPLRTSAGDEVMSKPLSPAIIRELRRTLAAALDTANQAGWGGTHAPKEHAHLDHPASVMRLLAEWRRNRRGYKRPGMVAKPHAPPDNDAAVELCKGIATKIVANHARTATRISSKAVRTLHEVADAHLTVDMEEFGKVGGDQSLQDLAKTLLGSHSGERR